VRRAEHEAALRGSLGAAQMAKADHFRFLAAMMLGPLLAAGLVALVEPAGTALVGGAALIWIGVVGLRLSSHLVDGGQERFHDHRRADAHQQHEEST
jgi:hypothetical protein